eukprot:2561-Prymnesium_polylepis.1
MGFGSIVLTAIQFCSTAFYLWASVLRGAALPLCKPSRVRARNDIAPRAAVGVMACVLIYIFNPPSVAPKR